MIPKSIFCGGTHGSPRTPLLFQETNIKNCKKKRPKPTFSGFYEFYILKEDKGEGGGCGGNLGSPAFTAFSQTHASRDHTGYPPDQPRTSHHQ